MVAQIDTKPTKTIPDIAEPPLIGSMFTFQRDRLGLFLRVAREYGDIACLHFGPFPFVQINAPALVPDQQIEPDPSKTITIRPKYGIKMVVRRRNAA